MPVRRGVIMRADGISDSYGTPYVRDEGTGQLYRVGNKRRTPNANRISLDNSSVVDSEAGRNDEHGADVRAGVEPVVGNQLGAQ